MADIDQQQGPFNQKIWQIVLIGFIAIAFTTIWLITYENLNSLIWMNDFVKTNQWTIPAGVLIFSFLVGLSEKYLDAPTVIGGGFAESMQGGGSHGNYRLFPGTLVSSFLSLFSGASVGPEGPLAFLITEISAWVREKLKVAKESALGFDVAALSSAYNGIIGSPLFTAVFATEFNVGKKDGLKFLAWNLVAGIIGFLFIYFIGLKSFANFLSFPPIKEITGIDVMWAVILGLLGSFVAVLMGLAMKGSGVLIEKTFKDRIMARIMFAGVIIAIVCYFIPDLMFSGETQIHSIMVGDCRYRHLDADSYGGPESIAPGFVIQEWIPWRTHISHNIHLYDDRPCIKPGIPRRAIGYSRFMPYGCRRHPCSRGTADCNSPGRCGWDGRSEYDGTACPFFGCGINSRNNYQGDEGTTCR